MATGTWTEADVLRVNAKRAKGVMSNVVGSPTDALGGVTHPPKSTSKYRNVKCEYQGEQFDSRHELEDWMQLQARAALGEISELRRQVTFPLFCPVRTKHRDGHTLPLAQCVVANYVADFVYVERGQTIVQDAKGHRTREYLLKRKWLELQDGVVIRET